MALPALHVLRMEACWMEKAEPLRSLAPALRQLSRLEQLDLGGNGFMGDSSHRLLSFWAALKRLTALTRLDLHDTRRQSSLTKLTQVGGIARHGHAQLPAAMTSPCPDPCLSSRATE